MRTFQVLEEINGEMLPVIKEFSDDEFPELQDNRTYKQKIIDEIRMKYDADDEAAILRKKLAGIDDGEFEEYNQYVESIKAKYKISEK